MLISVVRGTKLEKHLHSRDEYFQRHILTKSQWVYGMVSNLGLRLLNDQRTRKV